MKILRIILQIIGGIAIVGGIVVAILILRAYSTSGARTDHVTAGEAVFILHGGEIGNKSKVLHVLHSYQSPRSFTGDHIDAYCLLIDRFPEEVVRKEASGREVWLRPPIENPILVEAIKTASMMAHSDNLVWFPSAEMLNSKRYYLSFQSIYAHNQIPTAVRLIAYDREERNIYYADVKW